VVEIVEEVLFEPEKPQFELEFEPQVEPEVEPEIEPEVEQEVEPEEIEDEEVEPKEEFSIEKNLLEENDKFICKICNTAFGSNKQYRLHSRMHRRPGHAKPPKIADPKICKICNQTIDSNMELHLKAHEENQALSSSSKGNAKLLDSKKAKYACQYCQKEFIRPHEKVKHER
jgi:hypothetical protein